MTATSSSTTCQRLRGCSGTSQRCIATTEPRRHVKRREKRAKRREAEFAEADSKKSETRKGATPRSASGAYRRYHPDILHDFGAGVGYVVFCRGGNVDQHFFVERNVGLPFDVGGTFAVKNDQRFFIIPCRMPANALPGFQFHRAATHAAGLRGAFQQWTISAGAIQRKGQRRVLPFPFLRGHHQANQGRRNYNHALYSIHNPSCGQGCKKYPL